MRPGRWAKLAVLLLTATGAIGRGDAAWGQAQSASIQTQKASTQPPTCDEAFTGIWKDPRSQNKTTLRNAVIENLSPAAVEECGAQYLKAATPEKSAEGLFVPTREDLFKALQNYSAQQQQTSTTGSTASVTPVAKVTGPSAIAEELSGASISSSTSALTFQYSPGTTLSTLGDSGVLLPCSPVLRVQTHCSPRGLRPAAERLTLSLTTNTSTASQAVKGTAASTSSGSTTAAATLTTAGTTEPSFAGFGLKGVAIYTRPKSTGKTTVSAFDKKLDAQISADSAEFDTELDNCSAFQTELLAAADAMATQTTQAAFLTTLHDHYAPLGSALLPCLKTDGKLVKDLQDYLAAILVEEAHDEDVNAAQKPLLGFEYDLNTPVSQPTYSSMKANFSTSFGAKAAKQKKKAQGVSCSAEGGKATSIAQPACSASLAAIATSQGTSQSATVATKQSATLADAKTQSAAAKGSAATNTSTVTINASVGADLYNAEPPSTIPSASHLRDIQAGFEIDYQVSSSKIPKIGSLIGDSTLAGTYYYQDQTSPSILKGPPSSITIVNLPSTATTVYTTRGPINLGQIRYGLGTGSNVSFPICFTYSNRSELIAHPIKGFQFGLSYNLSALFTKSSK